MPKNVIARLKDTKIRVLLILGVIVIIAIGIGTYFILKKPDATLTEPSVASKLPEISAIPGGATSERYQQLLEEENRKRAEAARKAGTSAIATIIGGRKKEGSETFGIEGQLLAAQQQCVCPPASGKFGEIPDLDPARAAQLISELEANPDRALELLKQNPGLGKALCKQKPELAYQTVEQDHEAAKIILKECPEMAKILAEKNPELFKKLTLENPELARLLAEQNPELFKKLIENDPAFAKQLAGSNPDLVKTLMKNDPAFAQKMAKANPDMVKELMKNDPDFAKTIAKNNPDMVKELIKNDPDFAKTMAKNNPEMVKELIKSDPDFAKTIAKNNPDMVKELMKSDPDFAKTIAKNNPDMVKTLLLNDPDFAKTMARNNPEMINELMRNDPDFAKTLEQKNPGITSLIQSNLRNGATASARYDRTRTLEEARRRAAQEAAQRQLNELQQKQKQDLKTGMDNQAKTIFQAWNEYTAQVLVAGEWAGKKDAADTLAAGGGGTTGPNGAAASAQAAETPALFKAGTILFAALDTAVNSDVPGPILATIVDGRYRGAKLIGTMSAAPQPGGQPPEKVSLTFNQMNIPERPTTISIQAVAIDPDTARTAIATDVDHHYLLRYGSLFASSFLTGYSKVITSQGTVQVSSANGLSTTTTTPPLTGRKEIFAALGEVGKKFGEATASWFNIPPTITVDAGTGIGILFLADVNG